MLKKFALGASAAALAAMAPVAAVYAQETSSSVRGVVTDASGAPVSGASVTIIHEPTGSATVRSTGDNGSYNARGLRVGGPYTIIFTAAGYQSERAEGVTLGLGQPFQANVALTSGSSSDVIVVTGSAFSGDLLTGPRSTFTSEDINSLPSISRDPRDIARLSPFATVDSTNGDAISFAGTNNRFNSFTLDGVSQNDLFGLNASGFPSENRGPVSIDALESLSVEVAPFDVEYGSFQGGLINAVSKSGTNEFEGSLFAFYTDDNMIGTQSEDDTFDSTFEEKTWGATLGGPIIKDKLFFFASYEDFTRSTPLQDGPIGLSQYSSQPADITVEEVNEVLGIMESVYGVSLTPFENAPADTTDEKILLTLDWQINNDHRLKYTYNTSEGNSVQERNDGKDLGTPSTWYIRSEELESHSLQLFSDWTDALSTEVKLTYSTQDTGQDSVDGEDFANFEVVMASGDTLSIGPDFFRHANALANESTQLKLKADYVWNEHLFTAGYELFYHEVFNKFVPGAEGSYVFDSVADLQNQIASELYYSNSVTNNEDDAAASFAYSKHTAYIQDEWTFNDELTLMGGLRYEWFTQDDKPTYNASFEQRYGFRNDTNLDGLDIILPRFGFNYTPELELAAGGIVADNFTFRGGYGRFAGGQVGVWISNNFSNNGVSIDDVFIAGPITGVDAYNIPADAQSALTAGDGNTNIMDPSFDLPNTWRLNLATDFEFDLGPAKDFRISLDYLYGQNDETAFWKDLSCGDVVRTSFDGRPIYDCRTDPLDPSEEREDLFLTSVDGGESTIWTARIEKTFLENFDFMFSYTNSDVTEAHPGTSSTATSNYSDYATWDRQNPIVSRSNYARDHDFKLRLSWADDVLFEDYFTRVELFGSHRSGQPFSYTYDYSTGPGGIYDRVSPFGYNESRADDEGDLFYVPLTDASGNVTESSDPNVQYTFDAGEIDAFNAYLQETGLIKYSGSIAPRNAFEADWVTIFDLRFQQEIPAFFPEGAKGIFFLDIENVGNMINEDWGRLEQVRYEYFQPVVELEDILADGTYVYDDFNGVSSEERVYLPQSLWQVQFGVKYQF